MHKRLLTLAALAIILTACGNTEQTAEITTSAEETTTAESVTEVTTTESITETTTASTTTQSVTEETEPVAYEEEKIPLPENFSLADYIDSFDEAEPIQYTVDTSRYTYEYKKTPAAEQAALDAVNGSEYLELINAEARDMLEYKDGVYTCREDKWTFLTDTYIDYMGEDYKVEPRLLQTRSAHFDGKNREYIFTYIVPLHFDLLEWSGTTEFVIPVYVNSDNEAYILDAAAAQTLSLPDLLHYSDGVVHAAFTWGHTAGTTGSVIYSFSDGKPKLEFNGCGLKYDTMGTVLFNDISGFLGHGSLFFRDGIRDCYCGVDGVPVSDLLAEILRDNADIPDFDEVRDELAIYGGTYITYDMDTVKVQDGTFCGSEYGDIFREDFEYNDYQYWLNVDLTE
ncbi:MAG: hypothetical protein ACI4JF_10175 [Oscillospiraceae bacterium]